MERQTVSASTFTALLNALFISLAALEPHGTFGTTLVVVGALSLLSTLALGWHLLRSRGVWRTLIRSALLYGGGVTLYGIELSLGSISCSGTLPSRP